MSARTAEGEIMWGQVEWREPRGTEFLSHPYSLLGTLKHIGLQKMQSLN